MTQQTAARFLASTVAAANWLMDQQHEDGHFRARLEGDSILESESILLFTYLGKQDSPLAHKLAKRLAAVQEPEGHWGQWPGAPIDISTTVKAYLALRIMGWSQDDPAMVRAKEAIQAAGGPTKVNSYTRFYLALLSQIDYRHVPAVPPQMMLLPRWLPINIYRMSSWTRTIVVPLSLVWVHQPAREMPSGVSLRELFDAGVDPTKWPPLTSPGAQPGIIPAVWRKAFRWIDATLKLSHRIGMTPFQRRSINLAVDWLKEHCRDSDGPGAIYPPLVWARIAMDCLGHDESHPDVQYFDHEIDKLVCADEDRTDEDAQPLTTVQPCQSPVWDTAISLRCLAAADRAIEQGETSDDLVGSRLEDSLGAAWDWLLSQRIDVQGDWSKTVKTTPSAWCFEYANAFYPDNDDTAMSLSAIAASRRWSPRDMEQLPGLASARDWLLAMQNKDGGWGAFDKDNDAEFLCHVPFADHNAMIDPSCPDITGRVLEALSTFGHRVGERQVDRAVAFIRKHQRPDGSWQGRWGINYIYGTWQALCGLTAAGVPTTDPAIERGAQWLLAHQQACGGWGETPATYDDPNLAGTGDVTASQTAWAIMGLTAAGRATDEAVIRAGEYLADMQTEEGTWIEPQFTGTGFPQVFYLRYHFYRHYFPLRALSQLVTALTSDDASRKMAMQAESNV